MPGIIIDMIDRLLQMVTEYDRDEARALLDTIIQKSVESARESANQTDPSDIG